MLAGYKLGAVLVDAIRAVETGAAVAAWEEETFTKAKKWTREAFEGVNTAFEPGAPYNLLEQAKEFMNDPAARKDA